MNQCFNKIPTSPSACLPVENQLLNQSFALALINLVLQPLIRRHWVLNQRPCQKSGARLRDHFKAVYCPAWLLLSGGSVYLQSLLSNCHIEKSSSSNKSTKSSLKNIINHSLQACKRSHTRQGFLYSQPLCTKHRNVHKLKPAVCPHAQRQNHRGRGVRKSSRSQVRNKGLKDPECWEHETL